MRTATLFLVSSFAITALSASPAFAERQSYPGATCQAAAAGDDIIRNGFGLLRNNGSDAASVVCPLVVSTEVPVEARIYVADMRTDASVVCRRRSIQSDGDLISVQTRSTGDDGGDVVAGPSLQLNFSPTTLSVNGAVSVTCALPGKPAGGHSSGVNVYLGYD